MVLPSAPRGLTSAELAVGSGAAADQARDRRVDGLHPVVCGVGGLVPAAHAIDYFEHDEADAPFDAVAEITGKAAPPGRWSISACGWACAAVSCTGCTATASTGSAAQSKPST